MVALQTTSYPRPEQPRRTGSYLISYLIILIFICRFCINCFFFSVYLSRCCGVIRRSFSCKQGTC